MSNKSVVVYAAIPFFAGMSFFAGSAPAQIRSNVIAATGTSAPAGGIFQSFLSVSTNSGGQLGFLAGLTGTSNSGIFVLDRSTISAVALAGNAGMGVPNFLALGAPTITANGDVLFTTDTGLFLGRAGRLAPVVRNGDTFPGVGSLTPASFAVDANGNVFVADTSNNAVKEILAPGYTTVKTLSSEFNGPQGVAVDSHGNVFVADTYNRAVKVIVR